MDLDSRLRNNPRWITNGQHAGWNIPAHDGAACHYGIFANLNAMPDDRKSANNGAWADDHAPGAKLIPTELMSRNSGADAHEHVILDGQQLRKGRIDPHIRGDMNIVSYLGA
jgi:hypothetical protein